MRQVYMLCFLVVTSLSASAQLVINEVLYDPSNSGLDGDANNDGVYDQEDDSFIEFVNTGTTNFDASGYQIWDDTTSGQLRYVIPAGTWVPPNGALVVFGGGTLNGTFGGAVLLKTDSTYGMSLTNSGEVIAIKDANGQTVLTFDSDALSNNPNESYTRFPDLTGAFLQHGDTTSVLFSPGTMTDGTPFDTLFVVESIGVQGQGGASSITTNAGTLQMEAAVLPAFADMQDVTWSVSDPGLASIDANGMLTAEGNGTVTVTATATDWTGITGTADIAISNQTVGIADVSADNKLEVYPNPATDQLRIKMNANLAQVSIYSVTGQLVKSVNYSGETIDISTIPSGLYIIKVSNNEEIKTATFIKE